MNEQNILVATTIAPNDIENQQKAIKTWINAGFKVISCNAAEEIEAVVDYFPNVRFIKLDRDGSELTGKPYPYVYDVFQALYAESEGVCGVINSDIHVIDFPPGLMGEICKHACEKKLIYSHRMDTKSLERKEIQNATILQVGIDIFFFHKDLIRLIPDDGFLLGNVCWDYWMPIVLFRNGIEIMNIKQPVFYHIYHDRRWQDLFEYFQAKITDKYFNSSEIDYIRFMHKTLSRVDNGLYKIPSELENKKVLIQVPDYPRQLTLESIKAQSHKNCRLQFGRPNAEDTDCDFVFKAKANHVYAHCAISVLIYEMERNKCDAIACDSMVDGATLLPSLPINKEALMTRKKNKYGGRFLHLKWTLGNALYDTREVATNLYLYPAGTMTRIFLNSFGDGEYKPYVLGLCDKNPELWGKEVCGYKVYPPSVLNNIDSYDKVAVITVSYEEEICKELSLFLPSEKIVTLYDLL